MRQHVTIIGGGVIGLATAYALNQRGHSVVLMESEAEIALGASFANGGQLSYRYVAPLADAWVPIHSLKYLGQSDAPLNLRLRATKAQWSWLSQFILACNRKTHKINAAHTLRLSLLSQTILDTWRANDVLQDFSWAQSGKIIIHRQNYAFNKAIAAIDPKLQQILSPEELCTLEPALNPIKKTLKGAIFSPADETADCYAFCQALYHVLQKSPNFSLLTKHKAEGFVTTGNKISHIITNHGPIKCDAIVLAAGTGAMALLKKIHSPITLYPLKGYSLTLPFPTTSYSAPSISVTDYQHKIVYARLQDTLRIAAMVDIGYEHSGIRPNRIEALKNHIQATFPELTGLEQAKLWSGLRPATPKGPPIIGASPYENLWFNVGHGSLGFTLACASATVITSLINNESPPIDLTGLH